MGGAGIDIVVDFGMGVEVRIFRDLWPGLATGSALYPCRMKEQDDFGLRLSAFARALPTLCAQLHGDARVDAVHRLYEEVLCATSREHLDQAHDAMVAFMRSQGLMRSFDRAA